MLVGLVALIGINIGLYGASLVKRFPIDILIAISCVPWLGFVFGFVFARLAKEPPRSARTIMLETGLKNAQICLIIMMMAFPPEKIGVLMMMPLYFLFFQVKIFNPFRYNNQNSSAWNPQSWPSS